jgi:Na+/melibiose symporter-like transporter
LLKPVALQGSEQLAATTRGAERIALRTGLGYGVGMVGERLFRDAPALLLLVFMTNYLGIPAVWAGVAIFVPKLLLVFVDPFVGFKSDTSRRVAGRRKPFLAAGAFLSAAACRRSSVRRCAPAT